MATRKRYTCEDRARVLDDVVRLGVCGAAKQHGVPPSCVSRWRTEAAAKVARAAAKVGARTAAGGVGRPPADAGECGEGSGDRDPRAAGQARSGTVEVSFGCVASRSEGECGAGTGIHYSDTKAGERPTAAFDHEAEGGRVYTPSERARAIERVAEVGMAKASRELKISRYSLWSWVGRLRKAAAGGGDDPTSGPAVTDIEAQRDREILGEVPVPPTPFFRSMREWASSGG